LEGRKKTMASSKKPIENLRKAKKFEPTKTLRKRWGSGFN
jgi:hypothetical protein